jgi:hypothetical protein
MFLLGGLDNNLGTLLDGILQDINPNTTSERTPKYSVSTLLVLLKSTGSFNPELLKQLSTNLQSKKQ